MAKIGFFDSGIGGLSVLHLAQKMLPAAEFVFYADEDHVPYGTKPKEMVLRYVTEALDFLYGLGTDAVVLACNTATSVAAEEVRRRYPFPIVGMEPAAKRALDLDPGRRVLVAATPITVRGDKMQHLMERIDKRHLVDLLALPRLVEFAERGEFTSKEVEAYLQAELAAYDWPNYSALVLGCTHFNYFQDSLRKLLPPQVRLIDGNEGTVRQLKRRLAETAAKEDAASAGKISYYFSGRKVTEAAELRRLQAYMDRLEEMLPIGAGGCIIGR